MTTKTKGPKVAARTPRSPHPQSSKASKSGKAATTVRTAVGEKARRDAIAEIDQRIKLLEHGNIDEHGNITPPAPAAPIGDHSEQTQPEEPLPVKKDKSAPPALVPTPDVPATAKGAKKGASGASGAKDAARANVGPANAKGAKSAKAGADAKPKRLGGLDVAAQVLARAAKPMTCKEIVGEMLEKKLWTTTGKTPEATIYAAIIREIAARGRESRFKKTARGQFEASGVTDESIT
ncbi:MAG: HTH domain-containing protein [Phycisphaerales bacterium]